MTTTHHTHTFSVIITTFTPCIVTLQLELCPLSDLRSNWWHILWKGSIQIEKYCVVRLLYFAGIFNWSLKHLYKQNKWVFHVLFVAVFVTLLMRRSHNWALHTSSHSGTVCCNGISSGSYLGSSAVPVIPPVLLTHLGFKACDRSIQSPHCHMIKTHVCFCLWSIAWLDSGKDEWCVTLLFQTFL